MNQSLMNRPATRMYRADDRPDASGLPPAWEGLWPFLMRHKQLIGITTVVVFLCGALAVMALPRNFIATATIQLRAASALSETTTVTPAERTQREIEAIRSRDLAARTIARLQLEKGPELTAASTERAGPFALLAWALDRASPASTASAPTSAELEDLRKNAIIDAFMARLTVIPIRTADLIQVTYASRDPRTAYLVANELSASYLQSATAERERVLQKAADALQERIAAVKVELREMPTDLAGASTIERQLEARRTLLQAYITKLGDILLQRSALEPPAFIQAKAVYPTRRSGVSLALAMPILLVGGVLAGIGTAIARESLRKTVASHRQFETLLGTRIISQAANAPTAGDRSTGGSAGERVALALLLAGEGARGIVGITAPRDGADVTALAASIADSLNGAGYRTALIDGSGPGLKTAQPGLGDVVRLAEAAEDQAKAHDFVLISLDPVATSPAAKFLAAMCTLAVVVLPRRPVRRDAVVETAAILRRSGTRIVGAVVLPARRHADTPKA